MNSIAKKLNTKSVAFLFFFKLCLGLTGCSEEELGHVHPTAPKAQAAAPASPKVATTTTATATTQPAAAATQPPATVDQVLAKSQSAREQTKTIAAKIEDHQFPTTQEVKAAVQVSTQSQKEIAVMRKSIATTQPITVADQDDKREKEIALAEAEFQNVNDLAQLDEIIQKFKDLWKNAKEVAAENAANASGPTTQPIDLPAVPNPLDQ